MTQADGLSKHQLESLLDANLHDAEAAKSRESRWGRDDLRPPINSVCILGGGTAGWLTAIALREAFAEPKLEVTLIEAPDIPIIGVGEATVSTLPPFLHGGLGLDIVEFYRQVRPTWKLGIRFEWGSPQGHHFNAPFGWESRGIGLLGSIASGRSVNAMNLDSLLMDADKAPVFATSSGSALAALDHIKYAYHLDNKAFVTHLAAVAKQRGVRHRPEHITDAVTVGPQVRSLVTRDGREIEADFFVDCSGFGSFLLGKKLGAEFSSFESSLFTDRALAFARPHGGMIKPYTTAKTMDAGWCWNIPMEDADHCGYVYSSEFISEEQARRELAATFPDASEPRLIRFRSGRRDRCWVGNAFAVGNAYGFVEPLESTGILMIQTHIEHLITGLRSPMTAPVREGINDSLARRWDSLRWFLAIHFRFNRQRDTEYWKAARVRTNISGLEGAIELYKQGAPLALRNPRDLHSVSEPFFYGVAGLDCLLLGQGVPTRLLSHVHGEDDWNARLAAAEQLVEAAVDQDEALDVVHRFGALLEQHAQRRLANYIL